MGKGFHQKNPRERLNIKLEWVLQYYPCYLRPGMAVPNTATTLTERNNQSLKASSEKTMDILPNFVLALATYGAPFFYRLEKWFNL